MRVTCNIPKESNKENVSLCAAQELNIAPNESKLPFAVTQCASFCQRICYVYHTWGSFCLDGRCKQIVATHGRCHPPKDQGTRDGYTPTRKEIFPRVQRSEDSSEREAHSSEAVEAHMCDAGVFDEFTMSKHSKRFVSLSVCEYTDGFTIYSWQLPKIEIIYYFLTKILISIWLYLYDIRVIVLPPCKQN